MFERSPIDIVPQGRETLHERFVSQRGPILKVLMEDVIKASDSRLRSIYTLAEVRSNQDYLIGFSPIINADVAEIWRRLLSGLLHKSPAVIEANTHAARIITDLFLWFCLQPGQIDPAFAEMHASLRNSEYMNWYTAKAKKTALAKALIVPFGFRQPLGLVVEENEYNLMIPTEDVVLAKDYVASLSDETAAIEHRRIWAT